MENRIAPTEERKLTRAIEKAATLASINDTLDRNQLLIDALKDEGVDKRFAKVASAAFNKRVTVLTFKKTADEHKAEPFALTDADLVYQGLGGEVTTKTASALDAFKIEMVGAPMHKAAATEKPSPTYGNYEDRVDYQTYQAHLESMLDKHAAAISKLTGILESLDSQIKEASTELAAYFQKSACASFEFNTLINGYGDTFVNAVKDYLPETTDFSKTASAVVLPAGGVYDEVAELLTKRAAYDDILTFLREYSKGVSEFCKTAAAHSALINKLEWNGLTKEAFTPTSVPGNILRGTALTGMMFMQGAENVRGAMDDALAKGFGNARALYNAGGQAGTAPGEILDADFLIKDRYRDRMMAWSDMSADPQFSMYPAEQVFQATQKAMDTDSALERPDRREVLRAQVGQLLAQNNRASTADIAALATTLKALSTSTPSAPAMASEEIVARDKKEAPELPTLEYIAAAPTDFKGVVDRLTKGMETAVSEAAKEREKIEAKAKETKKDEQSAKEKRTKEVRALAADRQKVLSEYLRDNHIQIEAGANGQPVFYKLVGGQKQAVPVQTIVANVNARLAAKEHI